LPSAGAIVGFFVDMGSPVNPVDVGRDKATPNGASSEHSGEGGFG